MAKEHGSAKKEKKHKEKHTEDDRVVKSKKDKSEKKSRKSTDGGATEASTIPATKAESEEPESADVMEVDNENNKENNKSVVTKEMILNSKVPFAIPIADEKAMKKVFKTVKKGMRSILPSRLKNLLLISFPAAKHKALKRGVKEVVKSLRKSGDTVGPHSVVVIAADIWPIDVISHLPILCEDHKVPYIFVPSRAELGAAGSTTRPTSVVMITQALSKNKKGEEADEGDWKEAYDSLVKLVKKAHQDQVKV